MIAFCIVAVCIAATFLALLADQVLGCIKICKMMAALEFTKLASASKGVDQECTVKAGWSQNWQEYSQQNLAAGWVCRALAKTLEEAFEKPPMEPRVQADSCRTKVAPPAPRPTKNCIISSLSWLQMTQ